MLKVTWWVLAQLLMHHFNGHFSKQRERLLWERCTVLLKKREVAGSKCVRTWGGGGPGAVMKETKRNASANESSASPIVIYELYHSFSQFFPVPHSCRASQSVHCINHWHINKHTYIVQIHVPFGHHGRFHRSYVTAPTITFTYSITWLTITLRWVELWQKHVCTISPLHKQHHKGHFLGMSNMSVRS